MPRRGEFSRDFPEDSQQSAIEVSRIGERIVRASTATRRNLTNRILPGNYQCAQLAAELADEWVEYVTAAGLSAGTVQSYQQAIKRLCASADAMLGSAAPNASLGRDHPDLARVVAAWERTLPSEFATGSTRPSILSGAIRVLVRRRVEHPQRPVTERVTAMARAGSGVPIGETTELDEFSRKDKQALVRGAWNAVVALEKRLAAGWERASQGQHPDCGSWMSIDDLLWGLAHNAILPVDIHHNLPSPSKWPDELRQCVMRSDGTIQSRAVKQVLDRWLAAQLWPNALDLHAFRILLVDATGHAPEEVSSLCEDDVEFLPGGVRLTLVKKRARRRYYRAFKDASLEMADVVETEDFQDEPRREVGSIVRRLLTVTERARLKAAEPDRKLFVRAAVDVDLTLKFCEWNPEAPLSRFSAWLRQNNIAVTGKQEIRRLRKSVKVEKSVTFRGRIHDIADDHHEETYKGHYAQGTTLRVISAEVINTSQEHWFNKAVDGPTVFTTQVVASVDELAQLQTLGLSEQEASDLIQGELDMGVTHCKNPYDSPFSPRGELCAVAPLRCLECCNAWVMPSQLPQLLLFRDHLERVRQRLHPQRFTAVWGQSYANLRATLEDRSEEEITVARKHIEEGSITLDLPLSAHVEFDA
ncbi:hypothetical protein [Streptomyces fildesensis]|uniref:hypothetical protein n=1 Tax=Streptomyces fildesensis TaxID=375757 RepID=UPI0018DF4D80|nr:hypothetical protein [Streptomyces fildesensis]